MGVKLWFDIGEDIVCHLTCKKEGVAVDLDALPKITIYDPDKVVVVGIDGVNMSEVDAGDFTYIFDTVGKAEGNYRVSTNSIHGGISTTSNGGFRLREV